MSRGGEGSSESAVGFWAIRVPDSDAFGLDERG